MPSIINSDDGVVSGSSGLKTTGGNDGILSLQNNGTTNVTVTAAGSVGIGTSSPSGNFQVSAANPRTRLTNTSGTTTTVLQGSDSGAAFIGTETNAPYYFVTNNTEQARITAAGLFQFNSGYGSVATAYGCRAWVNFNGTGTVAIRASGNVTSITDNGVGDYTVNFTTAMPDANYSISANGQYQGGSGASLPIVNGDRNTALSISSCRIACNDDTGGRQDANIFVAVFR
jgi:hypothetical protein